MDKYTWVAIYKEIAAKLIAYRERQQDLINILAALQERGLPTIALLDKNAKDEQIPLTEIDPFTFFANFNRGLKTENRIEIIKGLKELFNLTSEVPLDFTGIPVVNNQKSWFFAYKKSRGEQDIHLLWELFSQALDNKISPQTFDAVLRIRFVRYNITMGLFWINPDQFLNLDSVNRKYLTKHSIQRIEQLDFQAYVECMERTKIKFQKPFYEISFDAWLDDNQSTVTPKKEKPPISTGQRYWLYAPGSGGEHWESFYSQEIMAIGWDYLGDLHKYPSKQALADTMREHDSNPESSKKNDATSCFSFCNEMQLGDVVFAKIGGSRLVGWGIISSDYAFDTSRSFFKHVRHVDWKLKGQWSVSDDNRFALKTVTDVTRFSDFTKYLLSLMGKPSVSDGEEATADMPNSAKVQYWWLNANPKIWDIVAPAIGTIQTYTSHNAQGNKRRIYQYFKQVRPGDVLFGYVASPLRQVVALCKVTKGLHQTEEGEVFEFEKVVQFAQPVSFRELQAVPELKKCEPLINNQGSLFKVTAEEYEIIRNIIDEANEPVAGKGGVAPLYSLDECSEATGFAKEKLAYWVAAIERKKQAILFGPPGTGKTFLADHLARHIVSGTDGLIDFIQFHPAYSYEEFMQGIRPDSDEKGNLQFDLKPGRFLEFCAQARLRKGPCVLVIDEINRANLARVFGELMYLLEYRDKGIPLAAGMRFSIPENVRIIGTMNTADRSIALVDFALRRRFAFLELSPEYDVLLAYQRSRNFNAEGLIRVLRDINATINDKNYYLGISFFLTDKLAEKMEEIWKMEIEPYLEEYFFSQPEAVARYRWDKAKDLILS